MADGFSFPTSLAFDAAGTAYVAESGLPFGGAPPGGRVWRLARDGRRSLLAEGMRPPVNGLASHDGGLYVSEGGHPGRISHLDLDGRRTVILDGLPGPGNYHTNTVAFGPDGKLYFSQGAMTNTGIVGLDAYELGWLRRLPHAHDLPGYDIVLTGSNVETANPLSDAPEARVRTGAFSPFGTETTPGQRIAACLPCTAAVMRCNPDGSALELVAWGLRNAYGLGFLPDGRLLATESTLVTDRWWTSRSTRLPVPPPSCRTRASSGHPTASSGRTVHSTSSTGRDRDRPGGRRHPDAVGDGHALAHPADCGTRR